MRPTPDAEDPELPAARRRLLRDAAGMGATAAAFALVYGLAAREAGLSIVEGMAMSVAVLGGASQFAALGLIAAGTPWAGIVLLTALLNARHLLYSAALAPWFARRRRRERAAAAYLLTDEAFALVLPHFRRLGTLDLRGYWMAAVVIAAPWVAATFVGLLGGQLLPDPRVLGLDVVFPAAMAALAVGLVHGQRSLVAASAGAAIGVAVASVSQPSVGVLAGGALGPLLALLVPADRHAGTEATP